MNPVTSIVLDLARERRWLLRNLNATEGQTWSGPLPVGALMDIPADDIGAQRLLNEGVPIVRIGRWPHPLDAKVPAIISGGSECGVLAADHFADRDFEHVACVGFDPWGDYQAIYLTLAAQAQRRGMKCHLHQHRSKAALLGNSVEHNATNLRRLWELRQEEFTQWLRGLPLPVGLLGFNDLSASRYLEWALAAGLRVPQDAAVLGIGNDLYSCETAAVPLSSIAHDYNRIAQTAMDLLERRMQGQAIEQTTVSLPPLGVIERQSTDVLAASDPQVVEALRFMWEHISQDLSVDQIVEHVGVSRRALERAFKRELGRGVAEEFRRRRLEESCKLLIKTDLRISQIAHTLNFNSDHQFFRAFRSAYGTTPVTYRRRHREKRSVGGLGTNGTVRRGD